MNKSSYFSISAHLSGSLPMIFSRVTKRVTLNFAQPVQPSLSGKDHPFHAALALTDTSLSSTAEELT